MLVLTAGGNQLSPSFHPTRATVLVVVATTSLPARLATRIRTADALRYE